MPSKTLSLDFTAKGKGAALVQIAYQYNVIENDPQPSFNIQTLIKKDTPVLKLEMDVCVEYADEGAASNMAILEVTLPSGYVADVEAFEHIESLPRVRVRQLWCSSKEAIFNWFTFLLAASGKPKRRYFDCHLL